LKAHAEAAMLAEIRWIFAALLPRKLYVRWDSICSQEASLPKMFRLAVGKRNISVKLFVKAM
jgi:hypothetical protein